MKETTVPYELPEQLHPNLCRVVSYWDRLKRGENEIPFWDDVKLSVLPDLSGRLTLIDVFTNPERFRFSFVGDELSRWSKESLVGKFADEIQPLTPFDYLRPNAARRQKGGGRPFFIFARVRPARSGVSLCRCGGRSNRNVTWSVDWIDEA